MKKKAAVILVLLYGVMVFSASAQITKEDWQCPAGQEFPVSQEGRLVTVQCGPNGTSATVYGCENITNVASGPCYQEPDSITGKISESTENLTDSSRDIKLIAAAGVLIAISVFFYEYFHG